MIVPLAIRRLDHAPHHPGHATTPRKHLVPERRADIRPAHPGEPLWPTPPNSHVREPPVATNSLRLRFNLEPDEADKESERGSSGPLRPGRSPLPGRGAACPAASPG